MSERVAFGFEACLVFDELIQYAIDESPGIIVREVFGQFESFIHRHFRRDVGNPEQFIHCLSQYIPIHHGHAIDGPILCIGGKQIVEFDLMRLNAGDQFRGKGSD